MCNSSFKNKTQVSVKRRIINIARHIAAGSMLSTRTRIDGSSKIRLSQHTGGDLACAAAGELR